MKPSLAFNLCGSLPITHPSYSPQRMRLYCWPNIPSSLTSLLTQSSCRLHFTKSTTWFEYTGVRPSGGEGCHSHSMLPSKMRAHLSSSIAVTDEGTVTLTRTGRDDQPPPSPPVPSHPRPFRFLRDARPLVMYCESWWTWGGCSIGRLVVLSPPSRL